MSCKYNNCKHCGYKSECEIFKENAELKKDNEGYEKDNARLVQQYNDLQKENAELKEQGDKWFVFETDAGNWGMDKATQHTVDRHNYFYGTKEECQKWGVEHKIKDYTGHKYCYDRLDEQHTKAKEIIREFVEWANWQGNSKCPSFKSIQDKAEQFLKGEA